MSALIECVPNFSEGRDPEVIRRITARIGSVDGATLLHVDPGKATNRTVVTIAGAPEAVVEAAFRAIAEAAELIDMRHHSGEHPRMGATDVCPLIPISGIGMEETAEYSRKLAERVGRELGIPVYLYEAAQPDAARKNLAVIRAGEYEGLARRMADPARASSTPGAARPSSEHATSSSPSTSTSTPPPAAGPTRSPLTSARSGGPGGKGTRSRARW
jgi:glutamate formiminotransferase/formiminotetrahydrofolate cyclodeaminase